MGFGYYGSVDETVLVLESPELRVAAHPCYVAAYPFYFLSIFDVMLALRTQLFSSQFKAGDKVFGVCINPVAGAYAVAAAQ